MLLRLTGKLSKKVGESPADILPLSDNPFEDWSCHLFYVQRTQYVIATNTKSLLSVLMYGRGITDADALVKRVLANVRDYMSQLGLEDAYEDYIIPATGDLKLSKSLNRSVTGSINDFVNRAEYYIADCEWGPAECLVPLNRAPMGGLDMQNPVSAFREMVKEQ